MKKKQFLFNPKHPKKSFDVYIDKNPKDTIPIKYKTLQEAEQQLVMWQKEDMGTDGDTIHTFASWQGAFSFMFTEANRLGSTDNEI